MSSKSHPASTQRRSRRKVPENTRRPAPEGKSQAGKLEEKLDEGLVETFPASDPVSAVQPGHSPFDKDG